MSSSGVKIKPSSSSSGGRNRVQAPSRTNKAREHNFARRQGQGSPEPHGTIPKNDLRSSSGGSSTNTGKPKKPSMAAKSQARKDTNALKHDPGISPGLKSADKLQKQRNKQSKQIPQKDLRANTGKVGMGKSGGTNDQASSAMGLSASSQIRKGLSKVGIKSSLSGPINQARQTAQDIRHPVEALKRRTKEGLQKAVKEVVKRAAKEIAKKIATVVAEFLAETAPVWVPIVAIILAILIVIFIIVTIILVIINKENSSQNMMAPNPLQLIKTGPSKANDGDILTYTLTVTYTGTAHDIQIMDPLPKGTLFVSSAWKVTQAITPTGNGNIKGILGNTDTLTWSVIANTPGKPKTISNVNDTFTFKLKATQNNLQIVNIATATVIGPIAAAGCGTFNKTATDFATFFAGQGRCTNVLGNQNAFVAAAIKNAGAQLGFSGDATELGEIYTDAVGKDLNPAIILSDWGTQSAFGNAGGGFGCNTNGPSFAGQLECEVTTMNYWMDDFQKQNKPVVDILPGNTACPYTDPFVYAYEYMTPVCHTMDDNGAARGNMVNFYKKILGI